MSSDSAGKLQRSVGFYGLMFVSLGSIIGMVELLQRGKIIFQGFRNPMETLYVVAVIYFAMNFVLEQISRATEHRRPQR